MNNYTLCPTVLSVVANDNKYLLDLLIPFAQTNLKKLCIDDLGKLEDEYKRIISKDYDLNSWYNWMSFRPNQTLFRVNIEDKIYSTKDLVVTIASNCFNPKMIVESKSDYLHLKSVINSNHILLLDKDEAILSIAVSDLNINNVVSKQNFTINTPKDVFKITKTISNTFKKVIEKNGGYKLLHKTKGRVDEKALQMLYFLVAYPFCLANDIKMSPECDSGVGPVDFNFSVGFKANVNVEIKFADNPKLKNGFNYQLKAYNEAEEAKDSIYLVVKTSDADERSVKNLLEMRDKLKNQNPNLKLPRIIIIDGKLKPSASNRKN